MCVVFRLLLPNVLLKSIDSENPFTSTALLVTTSRTLQQKTRQQNARDSEIKLTTPPLLSPRHLDAAYQAVSEVDLHSKG